MQVLDRTGVGTLWSICKTKFALAGHTHNYAGSGSAGGSANSAISVVDYGQTSKTIQIGYAGSGITGEQIKYIAGYTAGSGDVNAKIKDVSKEALRSWLGLGTLAYSSATITDNKVTQNAVKSSDYTNWRSLVFSAANSSTEGFTPSTTTDGVFIANTLSVQPSSGTIKANKFKGALEGNASTASNASRVNGHTVNSDVPSGAKFTDTNTWRGIQDNLTSTSTSESLSANQGRVLKGLVDGKANSSHTHTLGQITNAGNAADKNVRTLNSVSHSSWSSASTDNMYVPTMSFIAYWNGAYNSSGNSNLQYCSRGKFGALAVKDTADWSQITNKPVTATRWPSWGEVTSKPDLKNWSETKSYIDIKTASSGGIDSLPIGTELMSYNGSNIFGDKFVKEDGKYYKRSETSFDFGPIKSISPNRKYIQTTTEEGSTVLIYFNGYYYTKKHNKWCKSQTIDGQFSEAPELKDYSDYGYIGNGAFFGYYYKKVIILGGSQYSVPNGMSITYYKDGYFLTDSGITRDFKTYTLPETGRFNLCKNEGYFWVEDSTNYYLCIYDYTGKLLAKSKYSYTDHLGSFRNVAYCKTTNTAYVSTYIDGTNYEGVIYFNKNTSKMNQCLDNVYRNIFGSIVISAVEDSEEFTVSDCYENFPTYKFSTKGLHSSYELQIFSISILNGVPYVRCRYHNTYYDNYDCRHLIEITGLYSNDIYCQAKNSPSTFVKIK